MKTKIEKLENSMVRLEIEVDSEKFEEGLKNSFNKNAKMFVVPGFRRGKAPRYIIERYHGKKVFHQDAINFIFPDIYEKTIKENDLQPVSKPELDIKQTDPILTLLVKVTVKPDIILGKYKGIKAEKIKAIVGDEDLENEFLKILDNSARIISIDDREIQDKDIVVIDYEGVIDGKPFSNNKAEDYTITIGSDSAILGFEGRIIGMEIGEEKEFNVTFPDDYPNKEAAGKEVAFKVKIKEIKVKDVPIADDEFAKDISDFDTLDEYKDDLRKKLENNSEHEAEYRLENDLLATIVEKCKTDIPSIMIENQTDQYIHEFDAKFRNKYGGITLEQFLKATKQDLKSFRDQYKDKAIIDVKTQLALEKISDVEKIEASEVEVEEELKRIATEYRQDVNEFKKHLNDENMERIKKALINKKTIAFVVDNAKVKEIKATKEELQKMINEQNKQVDNKK